MVRDTGNSGIDAAPNNIPPIRFNKPRREDDRATRRNALSANASIATGAKLP
jgi:hypothetical protein